MDAAVREAREGEDRVCETLAYSDDIVVVTTDVWVLQSTENRWHREFRVAYHLLVMH